jgi:hypothetical protein
VEELLAVSVRQNRRRSGGVGVRVRRTKERRGGGVRPTRGAVEEGGGSVANNGRTWWRRASIR